MSLGGADQGGADQGDHGEAAGLHAPQALTTSSACGADQDTGLQTAQQRVRCWQCHRPIGRCCCRALPCIDNATPIVVVQHPRERQHAFNTVRLLESSLARCKTLVDYGGKLRQAGMPQECLEGAGLLYPHPLAQDITQLSPSQQPRQLIVIDGTWAQAKVLYRELPELRALPHFTLPAAERSDFAIRRQPKAHCLSTLEAVSHALRALEPGHASSLDDLLRGFRSWVGTQASTPKTRARERRVLRPKASRALPRALLQSAERLILVYVEVVERPIVERPMAARRELVYCVAKRLGDPASLAVLNGDVPLSPERAEHMRLSPQTLAAAVPEAELRRLWSGFVRPDDILVGWKWSHVKQAAALSSPALPTLSLKSAYGNLHRGGGELGEVIAREGLAQPRAPGSDRAHERLSNAETLLRRLRELAHGPAKEAQ